ncbi:DNA-directed RNA polymerase III subunit RPC5-like [Anneissia japonica]|uniref:DNA-directed RNA polymerase III subunit RPC5-like n=1 Tax=Anneissia japonica TaxID=1529436 RepID=UPI001425A44C|nr:DNA-directed RNA polymerase III subunit RPC5-like [Anneissia japonica]
MEEDDPVVEEVDVFLSKSLADNLYLFQYPVRPASMPYDDFDRDLVRIKPVQQKVEIELLMDTSNENYSHSKGEQIARNVDGAFPGEGSIFKSGIMNKQFLTSSNAVVPSEIHRYAVGMIQEGELHLTPLHGILQLRPNFKYLDRADNRLREEKANMEGESSQDEEEAKPKAVTVRYTRAETEESRARREASFQYIEEKMAQEAWSNVEYQNHDSQESVTDRNKLICQSDDQEVSQLYLSHKDYLSTLLAQPEAVEERKQTSQTEELSLVQLRTLGLADQVRLLLVNAKLLIFSDIMRFVHGSPDTTSVLKTLQTVAVLVQGCWVVKSEVLYPKDTTSPLSGIASEILCRGRDYMLWHFTQNSCIIRKDLAAIIKLPADDVKEIMSHVSRPVARQGWVFLYSTDEHFINSFPDVVQRQRMLWDAKLQHLANRSRPRTKSLSKSEPMDVDSPTNPQIANHNSSENVAARALNVDDSAAVASAGDPSSDLHTQQLKLQEFIRQKLLANSILSLTDLKKLALLKVAQSLPGEMSVSLSDFQVEQCAIKAGAVHVNVAWPPNYTGNSKLFTFRKIGDDFDDFRGVLLDMYLKDFKHRRNSIADKFREVLGKEPSTKADFDRVVKALCVCRGQFWYLKGTVPS